MSTPDDRNLAKSPHEYIGTAVPSSISLTAVNIYPIKSCGAVSVQHANLTRIGLAEDRRWQVLGSEERRGVTQRKHRSLALIQPTLLDDGGMRISAPGMPEIEFERPSGPVITVDSHFRIPVSARDAGDEAAEWLTEFIGVPLRLVRMEGDSGWRLPPELDVFGQGAAFTDAAPVLVANQGSLDWLAARASEDFGMDRFRPNLVVTGAEPWAEDKWDRFEIGESDLRAIVPWPRCAIPQVDQQTAERQKEPARVLRKHRWCTSAPSIPGDFREIVEGNGLFGVACTIGPVGSTIAVGDRVRVVSSRAPVLEMT
jgi:uncharacterized protein YcbX